MRSQHPGINQMSIPTRVIVGECRATAGHKVNDSRFRRRHFENVLLQRITRKTGLREWEWSAGEPFDADVTDESAIDDDEENEVGTETYARRRAAFTYTYGDDPIYCGRKIVLGRGRCRGFIARAGEWAKEVSCEDQVYVPEAEDVPNEQEARPFRQEVTAGDFLTAVGHKDETCGDERQDSGSGCSAISDDSSPEEDD